VAAGPGCNLLLWALLSLTGWPPLAPFAGAHLILGALNLLPVRPMDGGRLLWLLTALCTEPYTADRVAYAVGAVASAALLVLCLYLTLTTGAGLFLLPGVLWLAVKGVLPNGAKPDKISCYKK
jgi:stage IV sporulation protein FB